MQWDLLLENFRNPALLFFILGIFASQIKSDLNVPENSSKFISLYLLFSIGFKGGQELAHSPFSTEILWALIAGLLLALCVPMYVFGLSKKAFGIQTAGAIAASYGSVSAVTPAFPSNRFPLGGAMNGNTVPLGSICRLLL